MHRQTIKHSWLRKPQITHNTLFAIELRGDSVILKLKPMWYRRLKSVRDNNGEAMCFSTLSGLQNELVDGTYDRDRNGYICLTLIL